MAAEELASGRRHRLSDSVQFDSIFVLIGAAMQIYLRYFPAFFFTYALAVLPTAVLALVLELKGREGGYVMLAATVLIGIVAFSAVAIATSDASMGNRPSVGRAYRTVARRGLTVLVNSAICCLILALLMGVVYGSAVGLIKVNEYRQKLPQAGQSPQATYKAPSGSSESEMIVLGISAAIAVPVLVIIVPVLPFLFMYVPIISALEVRANSWRTIRRSISLGRGHRMRGVAVVAVAVIASILAVAVANAAARAMGEPSSAGVAALVVNLLVTPAAYIGVVLLYFDLCSRKEGYGFAEKMEDIY